MTISKQFKKIFSALTVTIVLSGALSGNVVFAQLENPQSDGLGLQGKISAPPPSTSPTISTPGNGQVISSLPIEVRGVCSGEYVIKLFKNNVFSGSDVCRGGSYGITIDLFSGRNELVARYVDDLNQQGPDSNLVAVTFDDAVNRANVAERILMTTVYARRGANPNETLTWPLVISGGTPPYAISVDWGDSTASDLYAVPLAGDFVVKHVYNQAGVYRALIKATDKDGGVGYLQLVAVSNGQVNQAQVAGATDSQVKTRVLWQPAAIAIPLILSTFYLGKKYEVTKIKHRLSKGEHPFD